jgi:hypothetical protein
MTSEGDFDVFVSHNSTDTSVAEEIAKQLKARRLRVWIDIWECPPGIAPFPQLLEKGLLASSCVAILFGPGGLRPWTRAELDASLHLAVTERKGLIPVLLPGHPEKPDLPCFVRQYPWVDMRRGVEEGIGQLVWGITGRPPQQQALEILPDAITISTALVAANRSLAPMQESQKVDTIGIAAVKRKLHISSEIIAQDAAIAAASAARIYPTDMLTMSVPLLVDLRWRRGYAAALKRLLKMPEASSRLRDFVCEEPDPPCEVDNGLLSAVQETPGRVEIRLQDELAAVVTGLTEDQATAIQKSVNRYGRLGTSPGKSLPVIERIKAIEVSLDASVDSDRLADFLFRQRDTLIPLLARRGMPGEEGFLEHEEAYLPTTQLDASGSSEEWKPMASPTLGPEVQEAEEINALDAWTPRASRSGQSPSVVELRRMLVAHLRRSSE